MHNTINCNFKSRRLAKYDEKCISNIGATINFYYSNESLERNEFVIKFDFNDLILRLRFLMQN